MKRAVIDTRIASLPSGEEVLIKLEPAQRPTFWWHGPWRWWSLITRDNSFWLTAMRSDVEWPVVRERWSTPEAGLKRAEELAESATKGDFPTAIAWRRQLRS